MDTLGANIFHISTSAKVTFEINKIKSQMLNLTEQHLMILQYNSSVTTSPTEINKPVYLV